MLTPRAADTASPWACRGGWLGEVALPAEVVGRHRRAADAIVGHSGQGSAGGGPARACAKGQEQRLGTAKAALRLCRKKGERVVRSASTLKSQEQVGQGEKVI